MPRDGRKPNQDLGRERGLHSIAEGCGDGAGHRLAVHFLVLTICRSGPQSKVMSDQKDKFIAWALFLLAAGAAWGFLGMLTGVIFWQDFGL